MPSERIITADEARRLREAATPGPWRVTNADSVAPRVGGAWPVAFIPGDHDDRPWDCGGDEPIEPLPLADAELIAAAPDLAWTVEQLTAERDEARRVLLALAEGCRSAHDYEMRTARPRDLEAPGRILKALHDALGLSDDTLWGDMAAALRRLCGVSDGWSYDGHGWEVGKDLPRCVPSAGDRLIGVPAPRTESGVLPCACGSTGSFGGGTDADPRPWCNACGRPAVYRSEVSASVEHYAARAERAERVLLALLKATSRAESNEYEDSSADVLRPVADALDCGLWGLSAALRKFCGVSDG